MANASAASQAEAARLAELEAAHRRAAAALEAELELLRRQKAEAEARGTSQDAQACVVRGWRGGDGEAAAHKCGVERRAVPWMTCRPRNNAEH